ncbi:MAG: flagellar hook-associated protein 3, partial [Desulfobacterales bacterium]|nr:flagellar hook-associated protein 3 [Desulfobacterales bacterium]
GDTISFDIVPSYENNNLGPDLGFDDNTDLIQPAQGSPVSGQPVTVVEGSNDTIAFVENLSGGESVPLTATIPPGTYDDPQDYARAVEKAMEKESAQSGNRVNYTVDYDSETRTYSISEDGVSGKKLDSFDLLFGSKGEGSAKADLGFTTGDVHSGPTHGDRADWGIFDTLFDLEEALAGDDVDGIQRAMTRLDQHYNSMTTSISKVGTQSLGLTTTQSGLTQSKYELTTRRSSVEDADSVESIMRLQAAETTYQAALSSTSSILGVSLVDYM